MFLSDAWKSVAPAGYFIVCSTCEYQKTMIKVSYGNYKFYLLHTFNYFYKYIQFLTCWSSNFFTVICILTFHDLTLYLRVGERWQPACWWMNLLFQRWPSACWWTMLLTSKWPPICWQAILLISRCSGISERF